MKRILHEEEYNQIVKIGKIYDKNIIKKLQHRLSVMGIDSHVDGDELFITVEQDRNDPHYVDDVASLARAEYNRVNGENNSLSHYSLAENEFRWICNECIKFLIEGATVNEVTFAMVSSLIKKDIYKKIKCYFRDGDIEVRSKFDGIVRDCCRTVNGNKKAIYNTLSNAIDSLMNAECREPNMTEYDMFVAIKNNIENYL